MNDIERAWQRVCMWIGCTSETEIDADIYQDYQTIKIALEKQSNGGWIPVSERLPKEDEEVLITMAHGLVIQAYLYQDKWNTFMSTYSKDCVIAWQPLPEPYKEETNASSNKEN